MAKVTSRVADPERKVQTVTIEDEFKARMILVHPLTRADYDPEAEEAKAIALMDENAAKYKEMVNRLGS